MLEHTPIERLAKCMRVRFRRDECGCACIIGKQGNIHEDGAGYSLLVMLDTARKWSAAKAKLKGFCQLRQDGDTEGVLYLARLPTLEQAEMLRTVLGIRKVPDYSLELLESKREAMRRINESTGKKRVS